MSIKGFEFVKRLFNVQDYDRYVARKVLRCLAIHQKGGFINKLRAKRLFNQIREKHNVCIYPSVVVGKNFYLAHGHDVTIGRTAVIGDNCKVYPYFYVMASLKGDGERVIGNQRRHAIIGNDCVCGAKSTIIGPVSIGDDVTIGAGAIITKNVPSHTVVKGVNQFRLKRLDEIPEKYREGWMKSQSGNV